MNRIEEQAQYFKNLLLRDRSIKAVVHLEDAEDERFGIINFRQPLQLTTSFCPTPKTAKERIQEVASNACATNHT